MASSDNSGKASRSELGSPWASPASEVLEELGVELAQGLHPSEVKDRRRRFGRNRLRESEQRGALEILIEQFRSIIVLLLGSAAVVSFAFGEFVEGFSIVAVILINAAIGFVTELRAVRSMQALRQLSQVEARVRREGRIQEVPAEELVPGDIVELESGDVITADIRLMEASKLQADESALTGESVPVSKQIERVEAARPLAERSSMVYKGTAVTRGAGKGVVVATGMDTELGHISSLVQEAEEEVTPLEKRLDSLGQRLVWVTLIIAAIVALLGIVAGKELFLIIETSIALAVATVPEGLPIVATVALARGMWRMSQRNALVRQLSAVETLGSTTVIFTDKTGTLTENEMTVVEIRVHGGDVQVAAEVGRGGESAFSLDGSPMEVQEVDRLRELIEIGVLCNNATLQQGEEEDSVGDPTELALLDLGAKAGVMRPDLIGEEPEAREVAFDPEVKMMATYHEHDGRYRVAVKGAPEAVLEASAAVMTTDGRRDLTAEDREKWESRVTEMAGEGLRVLAVATKSVEDVEAEPFRDLTFLGALGLLDPPREEVRESIASCQRAGIDVIMVTGDQPLTAEKIATEVDLVPQGEAEVLPGAELADVEELDREAEERLEGTPIFARVDPKQKLDLIRLYQDKGEIVAMTGDGVNDAPALKKADIGIAMGRRGTQVAREAADMVLKDDAFSTIAAAVEGGRTIFNNIRKFVLYLLSCNVSEIMVVTLASVVNAPLPIRPLQILYLNLVTDVFPALALGFGEGDPQIMARPPRDPDEPVISRRHWGMITGYSGLITVAVLSAFALSLIWLGLDTGRSVTISFLTLASAQLWHVFNMRTLGSGLLYNEVTTNAYVWGALALCVGLLGAAVYLPLLSDVLGTVDPGLGGWTLVLVMSVAPLIVGQVLKELGLGEV